MEFLPDFLVEAFQTTVGFTLLLIIRSWSFFWKILALYRTASRKHKAWFVILFFVNTIGILEIIYLLAFSSRPKRA
jgi:hypothetical protein